MMSDDGEFLYRDGRHYDLTAEVLAPDDIPFYSRQVKKYGDPVLELACGTGRIAIPLAKQAVRVTGLDISESMLSCARRKAVNNGVGIDWIHADCRDFNLDKKFSLIIFPYNSIAHIHDLESIRSLFSSVRGHLRDEGRFIIDIFNPCMNLLTRDTEKRYPVAEYFDPGGKGKVVITEDNVYDAATQINRTKWYFKFEGRKDEIVNELNMRIYYPQELDALLHYNGFAIESKYGDYDETPFKSASPKQIVVCRKAR